MTVGFEWARGGNNFHLAPEFAYAEKKYLRCDWKKKKSFRLETLFILFQWYTEISVGILYNLTITSSLGISDFISFSMFQQAWIYWCMQPKMLLQCQSYDKQRNKS